MTILDTFICLTLCLALGVGFWWAGERYYAIRDRRNVWQRSVKYLAEFFDPTSIVLILRIGEKAKVLK